jgi:hypothetical protein
MSVKGLPGGIIIGLLAVSGAAIASNVTIPHVFSPNTTARAAEVNENFAAVQTAVDDSQSQITSLAARVAALESGGKPVYKNAGTGKSYSLGAAYCGSTGAATGNLGGYSGAKHLCEAACGSLTAHMCTSEEIVRFLATSGTLPSGGSWYSEGVGTDGADHADCYGWTTQGGLSYGPAWRGSYADYASCNTSVPVLCCD